MFRSIWKIILIPSEQAKNLQLVVSISNLNESIGGLGIDENLFFGNKNGCNPYLFFSKIGVPPNHRIFRRRPYRVPTHTSGFCYSKNDRFLKTCQLSKMFSRQTTFLLAMTTWGFKKHSLMISFLILCLDTFLFSKLLNFDFSSKNRKIWKN